MNESTFIDQIHGFKMRILQKKTECVLGSYMNHGENLYTEYKEFCMKDNIYKFLDENQVSNLVRNGMIPRKFDQMILYNLCKYIDIYIPKYATSFHNTKNTAQSKPMQFMIGINDNSEITGVPYTSDLKEDIPFLHRYISRCMKRNIANQCCLSFNLRIKRCNVDTSILDDNDLEFSLWKQDTQFKWYMTKQKKYNKKRKQWVKQVLKYKGKLQSVLDDPMCREELKAYLKQHNLLHIYSIYLDTEYVIDVDQIKYDKKDPSSFVYWLIQYKDEKVDELMANKPKPPTFPKFHNVEYEASTKMSCLRKRLVQQNGKLSYYVVVIELKKNNECTNCIKYCDPRRKNWREVKRLLHSEEHPYSFDVELAKASV